MACASIVIFALLFVFPCVGAIHLVYKFIPTQGHGGILNATITDGQPCTNDAYHPSEFENRFVQDTSIDLNNADEVCAALSDYSQDWIAENAMTKAVDAKIFSKICRRGALPEYIEPLAGILRDPRFPCKVPRDPKTDLLEFSIDWLLVADSGGLKGGTKRFFDAGCTHFSDALTFFSSQYQKRGIVFDEVYAWEANHQDYEQFWTDVSPEVREFWEPRVHFYNGIPVSAELGSENNVVEKIYDMCGPTDFCAFKLDIDTPQVELPLVQQLLANPDRTRASLNEFFFEHHVHGIMQEYGWGDTVSGTISDSYRIFTELRNMGVRAHSWI